LVLLGLATLPLQAEVPKEYQVKAAFLYNFTRFVEWPAGRFADDASPIVIGVLGQNPFGDELEKAIAGRTVNGRSIMAKSVTAAEEISGVHILFVPAGAENRVPAAVWQNTGILTVGETEAFAAPGGTITFVREGDKVRFAINLGSAERSGLKLSAQLLKLATAVRRKP
jgi:hypothetical protein